MSNQDKVQKIRENVSSVIVGKENVTKLILTSLIAGGHILLEDVPGTGKTVMVKTLAASFDTEFARIQFTPDLLPSDVTGINFYNQKEGAFTLKKGPVFANFVLADEINRATPRTQSSLLECMEEHQVTIDGVTHKLNEPFIVIATENPIETAGTFPLPEAQLDRFLMKLSMGLPTKDEEVAIMKRFNNPLDDARKKVSAVSSGEELVKMKEEASATYISPVLMEYIASIVCATRNNPIIKMGVSPRGTLAMLSAVKAYAYVSGRDYVVPEDVITLAPYVFGHRIAMVSGYTKQGGNIKAIEDIVAAITVPTEDWTK